MQTGFPKNGKMLKNLFILVYKNTQWWLSKTQSWKKLATLSLHNPAP
jgi:hypothetical protein